MFGFCICFRDIPAQTPQAVMRRANRIQQIFAAEHIAPKSLNDRFSIQLHNQLIEAIDSKGLFWTQADLSALAALAFTWDEAIAEQDPTSLDLLIEAYTQAVARSDSLLNSLKEQPLHWTPLDSVNFSLHTPPSRAKDRETWPHQWEQYLKLQVLLAANGDSLFGESKDKLLQESYLLTQRTQAIEQALCRIEQRSNDIKAWVSDKFLKAQTTTYDPHSAYFSGADKAAFEASLATTSFSFGLELRLNSSGEVAIARLIPGGPAWHANVLHQKDVILSLTFPRQPPIQLSCISLAEVNAWLNDAKNKRVMLRIRKPDGKVEKVPLEKREITVDENVINGFVLGDQTKVGYLYLPGFYSDFEGEHALGCANDVATELLKLKLEGIEGLILDLRHNGGGSMKEAIDLAGLFVDEGPILYVQTAGEDPHIQLDFNRGTAYEDPLIILVNQTSASASEILAGTLQDYQRALIVGSPTYGKSTSQYIRPLSINRPQDGFLKITGGSLARITGKSHQAKGVLPDILLPGTLGYLVPGEGADSLALPPITDLSPANYQLARDIPYAPLSANSQARVDTSTAFQKIVSQCESLPAFLSTGYDVRLHPAFFAEDMAQIFAIYEIAEQYETGLAVANSQMNQSLFAFNENLKAMNQTQRDRIQGDIYIAEAYQILLDWLTIGN